MKAGRGEASLAPCRRTAPREAFIASTVCLYCLPALHLCLCLVPFHQAFSDYQLQQMTSNFIDQFGFNEDEFAEQDDRVE